MERKLLREEKVLLGTVKRLSKSEKSFLFFTILGEEIKVFYPSWLEPRVSFLANRGALLRGQALIDPETSKIVSLRLEGIVPYGIRTLKDYEEIKDEPQDLKEFEGLFANVARNKTTEEITKWQKEIFEDP